MKIIKQISPRGCANGACPSLRLADTHLVLVQGNKLGQAARQGLLIPEHEDAISIPKAVFEDLVDQYRAGLA